MRRNRLTKAVGLLLGIGLVFGMTAISEAKKSNPAEENIVVIQTASPSPWEMTVSPTSLTICVGKSGTVTATISPADPGHNFSFTPTDKIYDGTTLIATVKVISTKPVGKAEIAGVAPGSGTLSVEGDSPVSGEHFGPVSVSITVFGGEITGPSKVLVYCTGRAPNIQLKAARNQPEGVTYKWETISGADKIDFVGGTTGASVIVKGVKKSDAPLDVEIKLNYKLDTKTCHDTHKLTVVKPTSLDFSVGPQTNHYLPNGTLHWYERRVTFTLKDQFGHILNIAGIPIRQTITVLEGAAGQPVTGAPNTNSDGSFGDRLRSRIPIPEGYYRKTLQVIKAGGCDVGHFHHIFTMTEVTVTRAP